MTESKNSPQKSKIPFWYIIPVAFVFETLDVLTTYYAITVARCIELNPFMTYFAVHPIEFFLVKMILIGALLIGVILFEGVRSFQKIQENHRKRLYLFGMVSFWLIVISFAIAPVINNLILIIT